MCEKQLDHLEMASLAGPKYRCSLSISSFRIDIGSRLNEKVTQRVMAIDSSPL